MATRKISRDTRLAIYRELDEGTPVRQVAQFYGVSESSCYRIQQEFQGSMDPYVQFRFSIENIRRFLESRDPADLRRTTQDSGASIRNDIKQYNKDAKGKVSYHEAIIAAR